MAKIYEYKGDGEGVPGLPHVISDAQAEALGVLDLLKAAIKSGSYAEIKQIPAGKQSGQEPAKGQPKKAGEDLAQ